MAVATAAAVVSPASADGQPWRAKLDLAVAKAAVNRTGNQPVIVRVASGARAAVRDRLTAGGHRIKGEHASIDGLAVEVSATALLELAKDPDILSISSDAIVTATSRFDRRSGPSSAGDDGNLLRTTLGLDADAPKGQGVGVALIDSGVDPTADLAGRISAFFDLSSGTVRRAWPYR